MNKILQASLVATLLGAGSTALYADDDTASRPSYNWGNCTSIGCEKGTRSLFLSGRAD